MTTIPDPGAPSIGAVRSNQQLDQPALETWFRAHVDNPAEPLLLQQFNSHTHHLANTACAILDR